MTDAEKLIDVLETAIDTIKTHGAKDINSTWSIVPVDVTKPEDKVKNYKPGARILFAVWTPEGA